MNATEKSKVLRQNGYKITVDRNSKYGFEIFKAPYGLTILWNESKSELIHAAYEKLIVYQFNNAQTPTETPASESPQAETVAEDNMSKKITLKQMEAELHEWGGVYVDRVMRGNDKANRYEVNDPDGKRLAIGFERREVLEMAYAKMQEMIAAEAQAPTETQESEAPEAPTTPVIEGVLKTKNDEIVRLQGERDALQLSVHGLQAQLDKAKADLAAAQNIIIQAGKDFEALRNENARYRTGITRLVAHMDKALEKTCNWDKYSDARNMANDILIVVATTPTPPAQEALVTPLPKFTVGQAVWVVFSYGREFGLSNKAATVIEIKQEDGSNWYRVKYEISSEEGSQWWEEYEILPREDVPATPKRPVATRCRVNWNGRGFSSGSYEVLSYSQDKQVYVLNISSDDNKPMPKTVKMTDCESV